MPKDETLNRILNGLQPRPQFIKSYKFKGAQGPPRMAIRCSTCEIMIIQARSDMTGIAHLAAKVAMQKHVIDRHNGDDSNVVFEYGNVLTTPTIK